jgi:tripartite-type tricarboxylate transporter receptor subunit TctC
MKISRPVGLIHRVRRHGGRHRASGPRTCASRQSIRRQPIILVAPGTLGGGSETQARLVENIVTESGIFGNQPIAVLNKGGGGSQEAFTFLLSHRTTRIIC